MGKFKFKPYKGSDKYHFRIYKRIKHPFIIAETNVFNRTMSGYVITTSPTFKKGYYPLSNNPNPNDSKLSFVTTYRITDKFSCFSKPYSNWHLTTKDEQLIDRFESKRKNIK